MESHPRVRLVSFTFLAGFGIGSFVGVALAILAIALVDDTGPSGPAGAVALTTSTPDDPSIPTSTLPARPRAKTTLDVRLGPGSAFAVIGIMARGEAVDAVGRNTESTWIAVRFPPGSSGRGWVPVDSIEGLSDLDRLAVALPTPLPRSVVIPPVAAAPQEETLEGTPVGGIIAGTAVRGVSPTVTPTPRAGPTDIAITRITRLSDGRVSVVVGNRGPGDLAGQPIFVIVRDAGSRSEMLVANQNRVLQSGSIISLQSQTFVVPSESEVTALVDPFHTLDDPDRSNNSLTASLGPPASATPLGGASILPQATPVFAPGAFPPAPTPIIIGPGFGTPIVIGPVVTPEDE